MRGVDFRLPAVLLLIIGVLGYALWRESREYGRQRAAAASARGKIDGLEAKVAAAEKKRSAGAAPAPPRTTPDQKRSVSEMSMLQALHEHPELAALRRRIARRQLLGAWLGSPKIAALNLSPDKFARLVDLATEKKESVEDALAAAAGAGIKPDNPASLVAVMRQSVEEVDQQITALIGDSGRTMLYAPAAPDTGAVAADYAAQMAYGGAPLTPEQTASLQLLTAQVYAPAADPPTGTIDSASIPDSETFLVPKAQQLLDGAAAFLSPDQVEILKNRLSDVYRFQALTAVSGHVFVP